MSATLKRIVSSLFHSPTTDDSDERTKKSQISLQPSHNRSSFLPDVFFFPFHLILCFTSHFAFCQTIFD